MVRTALIIEMEGHGGDTWVRVVIDMEGPLQMCFDPGQGDFDWLDGISNSILTEPHPAMFSAIEIR